MRAHRAVLAIVVLGIAFPVAAADCPIERAVYREAEQSTELRFEPAHSDSSPVSHRFSLVASKDDIGAEGNVLYDEDFGRPVSNILKDCPEGDVTGADISACTVWNGIIYSVDATTGHVDLLPPEGADAPDRLLLPGFGPAASMSAIRDAFTATPWDVFEYKECRA